MVQTTLHQELFLFDKVERKIGEDNLNNISIPLEIVDNLNPAFEIRAYQKKAFQIEPDLQKVAMIDEVTTRIKNFNIPIQIRDTRKTLKIN